LKKMIVKRSPLFGVALLCAGVAHAGPIDPDVITVVVHYSDLDLSRKEGATRLYQRIKSAASQACGPYDSRELARLESYRRCYLSAVDGAVKTVGANKLTEVYRSRRLASSHAP
jgi:UrcA family protein